MRPTLRTIAAPQPTLRGNTAKPQDHKISRLPLPRGAALPVQPSTITCRLGAESQEFSAFEEGDGLMSETATQPVGSARQFRRFALTLCLVGATVQLVL